MSEVRELPCPHCLAPLRLRRADFFPTRRREFHCATCQQTSFLPWGGILPGLGVMLLFMFLALGFARPLFQAGAFESVMDFVWSIAAFLGIAFTASWLACFICSRNVDHLQPRRRRRAVLPE